MGDDEAPREVAPKDAFASVGQVSLLDDDRILWISGMEKTPVDPGWKPTVATVPLQELNEIRYRSIIGIAGEYRDGCGHILEVLKRAEARSVTVTGFPDPMTLMRRRLGI